MGNYSAANGEVFGERLTNYAAYMLSGSQRPRIGHLNLETNEITPLAHVSGTPLTSLYEVIEVGEKGITPSGSRIPRKEVQLLAPISGRDILAVGKNYAVRRCHYGLRATYPLILFRLMQRNSMPRGMAEC
jgi:hypothetical protein